ncbi:hypothetical protein [Actinobacillus capsulatus]|uniref:hypothetical protein n=1 Tax=Actinobacillus capsulatus TaxID=717 RepID=UPI0012DDBD5D|nr:hypothetical protein [Actinobacillus capsulatus]
MGRFGILEEVVAVVAFASDDAIFVTSSDYALESGINASLSSQAVIFSQISAIISRIISVKKRLRVDIATS